MQSLSSMRSPSRTRNNNRTPRCRSMLQTFRNVTHTHTRPVEITPIWGCIKRCSLQPGTLMKQGNFRRSAKDWICNTQSRHGGGRIWPFQCCQQHHLEAGRMTTLFSTINLYQFHWVWSVQFTKVYFALERQVCYLPSTLPPKQPGLRELHAWQVRFIAILCDLIDRDLFCCNYVLCLCFLFKLAAQYYVILWVVVPFRKEHFHLCHASQPLWVTTIQLNMTSGWSSWNITDVDSYVACWVPQNPPPPLKPWPTLLPPRPPPPRNLTEFPRPFCGGGGVCGVGGGPLCLKRGVAFVLCGLCFGVSGFFWERSQYPADRKGDCGKVAMGMCAGWFQWQGPWVQWQTPHLSTGSTRASNDPWDVRRQNGQFVVWRLTVFPTWGRHCSRTRRQHWLRLKIHTYRNLQSSYFKQHFIPNLITQSLHNTAEIRVGHHLSRKTE